MYFSFCFQFELLQALPCCLALYRWRAEKGCRDVFNTFETYAGIVVTSLLQTAGHKMAAPPFFKHQIYKLKPDDELNEKQLVLLYTIFFFFFSIS